MAVTRVCLSRLNCYLLKWPLYLQCEVTSLITVAIKQNFLDSSSHAYQIIRDGSTPFCLYTSFLLDKDLFYSLLNHAFLHHRANLCLHCNPAFTQHRTTKEDHLYLQTLQWKHQAIQLRVHWQWSMLGCGHLCSICTIYFGAYVIILK